MPAFGVFDTVVYDVASSRCYQAPANLQHLKCHSIGNRLHCSRVRQVSSRKPIRVSTLSENQLTSNIHGITVNMVRMRT